MPIPPHMIPGANRARGGGQQGPPAPTSAPSAPIRACFSSPASDRSQRAMVRISSALQQVGLVKLDENLRRQCEAQKVYPPTPQSGFIMLIRPNSKAVFELGDNVSYAWDFGSSTRGRAKQIPTSTLVAALDRALASGEPEQFTKAIG